MSHILGIGNPLLDISANVSEDMLTQYNLKADDAILYEKEDIYEELQSKYTVKYIPGGATQNSMLVAQWILGKPKSTAFFGCVGKDKNAEILLNCCKKSGMDARYQYNADHPTGKCAVLITGSNRSMVTKLDAAVHFTTDHLEPNWSVVENAQVFYSAGFFLTVSPDSMLKVAKHAFEKEKIFCMNISAPFLAQFFMEPMQKLLKYTSILFGNETEALAFAEKQGYDTKDVKAIAKKLSEIPLESKQNAKRTVIITQGPESIVVVHDGVMKTFPVEKVPVEEIVDTNGAGDAFVGGYLAQLVLGKDLETCLRCGIYAATCIIKQSGCTLPEKMQFK